MDDARRATTHALAYSAQKSLLDFLRVELKIANTMMDSADLARDDQTRERRCGRAREACAEVDRHLTSGSPHFRLATSEREELADGLRLALLRLAAC
jgi:hypothetical protein